MKEADIIKLLKTGNFTIAYHDNESPSLYEGKWKYEQLESKNEIDTNDYGRHGYCPHIIYLLVKALGGKTDSI